VGAVLVLTTFVSVLPGHYAGRYLRDEYQTAMSTLAAYADPEDAVLLVSGDRYPVFYYYYHRQFPDGAAPAGRGPVVYLLPQHATRLSQENVERELAPLVEQHARVWLASMERGLQDPDDVVRTWLDAQRTTVLQVDQGHNSLRLYSSDGKIPVVSSRFEPEHTVDAVRGGDVLLGYDLPTEEFRPGDRINLGLYVRSQPSASVLGVDWVGPDDRVIESDEIQMPVPLGGDAVLRLTAPLAVYSYTVPGRYWSEIYARGAGALGESAARVRLPVGRVTHSRRLPPVKVANPQPVEVGEGLIRFLGFELDPAERVAAGDRLSVELYWQAQQHMAQDYTVFVHVVGDYNPATGGPVWAQDDSYPMGGGHPTTRWLPGQTVADRHVIHVPLGTPAGRYQLRVGMYNALDRERLRVADADQDQITIGEIDITN
jgi:hypothetical protein